MQWTFCLRVNMPRECFDPPVRELIDSFLADTWHEQKLRKRANETLRREISGFAKLVPRAHEVVNINERTLADLIGRFVQAQRVARVHETAAEAFQACRVPEHIQHHRAAASRFINLNVDYLFGRKAGGGKAFHQGCILLDENLPRAGFGEVNDFVKHETDMLSILFFELLNPAFGAAERHWLGSVVAKP